MRYGALYLLGLLLTGTAAAQSAALPDVSSLAKAVGGGNLSGTSTPGPTTEPTAAPEADGAADAQMLPSPKAQTGDDFYCGQRALGRWFYCQNPSKAEAAGAAGSQGAATASQRVAAISKRMDELRDRAILDPSETNVVAFMRYQREQTDRASLMADVFERTLIAHPELDYNLQRPVSALGKQNWLEQRNQEITNTMLQLKQRYGVFFFFSSKSQASVVEAPILRSLADNYGLTVVAVSEDGGASQAFPDYLVDTGQRKNMGLPGKDVPMIALYDTLDRKTVLIATGVVAADDVMQRIFLLTKTLPGKDY